MSPWLEVSLDIFRNTEHTSKSRVTLKTSRWQQRLLNFSKGAITIHSTNQGTYQPKTYRNRFSLMSTHGSTEWNIYVKDTTLLRRLGVAVMRRRTAGCSCHHLGDHIQDSLRLTLTFSHISSHLNVRWEGSRLHYAHCSPSLCGRHNAPCTAALFVPWLLHSSVFVIKNVAVANTPTLFYNGG